MNETNAWKSLPKIILMLMMSILDEIIQAFKSF